MLSSFHHSVLEVPHLSWYTPIYKYLGVTLTSDLSWSEHIQSICVKSKKLIGLLYRRFYGNADPAAILILYCTLVRPHLEYACQVWSPYTQRDKDLLEKVQKFALRMSFRQWNASYRELLNLCNIYTKGAQIIPISVPHV